MTGYPFPEMTGPQFLAFYVVMLLVAAACVGTVRLCMSTPSNFRRPQPLTPLEVAFLAGGFRRAANAVSVGFLAAGVVRLRYISSKLAFERDNDAAVPFEIERFQSYARDQILCRDFRREIIPLLQPVQNNLVARGLSPCYRQERQYRFIVAGILLVPLLIGLVRFGVGVAHDRPVAFLLIRLAATVFAGGVLLGRPPTRTREGAEALRLDKKMHARVARAPMMDELMLAFALTGPAVLSGTGFEVLCGNGGGGGCGSGGGGGGCGGGGGGGGGGCGGGGCGG